MGSIKNLTKDNLNTHLLLSNSGKSELYVYDILKEKCKAGSDSIYTVNSRKSVDNMLELVNTQSFMSDKWLFVIEYGKAKKHINSKIGIFRSDTSEFLIKVKNYKEFKEAKELFNPVRDILNDVYLAYVNYYDVEYLLRDKEISDKLISYVYKSYSSDPEQIFVLLKELESGVKINTRKQISDICGVSAGTLNSFAISLLGEEPKGEKGKKTVIKNRIKVAIELAEVYGYSKLKNFLTASVKDILDIKTLYLQGVIYDRLEGIPEPYDQKRLARYRFYFKTIKEDIPYMRVLRLYLMLRENGKWYKDSDMINFMYQYYEKGELK